MALRRMLTALRVCLLAIVAHLASGCQGKAPPNIVLYVVDTLRFDALHCNGNEAVQTPAMDRLAADGLRFTNAHSNASWTRPSMGTLLTGVYPSVHGAVDRKDRLRSGLRPLARELRAVGYRTAAISANVNIGPEFGFADGFDEFIQFYPARFIHDSSVPREQVGTADNLVNRAIDWLRQRDKRPFFLLVFTVDPHSPYEPPAPYDTLYDPHYTGTIDGSIKSIFAMLSLAKRGQPPAARDVQHLRALYQGEVSFNDAHLMRLLDEMDRLGISGSTLFALTSDHGEEFYEHGLGEHGQSLYEELIHVPLLMRWPGTVAPRTTYGGAVQLIDLYPTLLSVAGAKGGDGPGRDLGGILRGQAGATVPSTVYAEEQLDDYDLRTLIIEPRKLIVDLAAKRQLDFDLSRDPHEQQPIAGAPFGDLVRRLDEIEQDNRKRSLAYAAPPTVRLPESVRESMEALGYGDTNKRP